VNTNPSLCLSLKTFFVAEEALSDNKEVAVILAVFISDLSLAASKHIQCF